MLANEATRQYHTKLTSKAPRTWDPSDWFGCTRLEILHGQGCLSGKIELLHITRGVIQTLSLSPQICKSCVVRDGFKYTGNV